MTTWVSDLLRNVHQHGQCDEDGSVTLANASPEVLAKIRDEADEVLSFGLQAVDGIGDAIYFLRHSVETESGERGMGLALQLLSDLMAYANEVKKSAQSAGAQVGTVDAESTPAPAADPGTAGARDALPGAGPAYFRALLFAGDAMAAQNCQLDLANASAVRVRADEAAGMLETHLNQVNRLLSDSQQVQPPRPSPELVDDLLWTTNELGGLLDALRALRMITETDEPAPNVDVIPESAAQVATPDRRADSWTVEALANPFVDIDPDETLENVREGLAMISSMATWTDVASFAGKPGAVSGLYRHVETMRAALGFERDRVAGGRPRGGATAAPAGDQQFRTAPLPSRALRQEAPAGNL